MSSVTLHCARHGDLFHFADDAVIGASLARYGEWAEQELWLMHHLLSAGDTVVDVGANVGCHTLAFSRFVGVGGRVIAVEAQPAMFRLLSANVTLNAVPQAHCVFALADTARGATALPLNLAAPEHNYGAVSFADGQHRHRTGAALPVAVMALDDLALDHCALVKIDVEGMELEVLQGAQRLLMECAPHLYFEQASDRRRGEIFTLLRGLGYRLYWHVANPFNRCNFNGARDNMFGGACETNVLAVPPGSRHTVDAKAFGLVEVSDAAVPAAPTPPADARRGWQLPSDAYARLPRAAGMSAWTARVHDETARLRHELAQLRLAFDDLLEDRRKAQEIMDLQHHQLGQLHGRERAASVLPVDR